MGTQRAGHCLALVGLAGLALVTAGPAWPHRLTRSHIGVTAQVAAVTRIEDLQQPAALTISPVDAARGYITARATLKVRSNVGGYTLTVWPSAAWFDSVRVDGVGTPAELPKDGGALVR